METIITIRKNKPAYRALIALARELKKNDEASISIIEGRTKGKGYELLKPSKNHDNPFSLLSQLTDFPSIDEIRGLAWPTT